MPTAAWLGEEGVRFKGDSFSTRIWVLVGKGQFAEAEALIAEGSAAGLLSKPQAARMLSEIVKLGTRLREVPASLQRAPNFPTQLRDHTLYEIEQMLRTKDFSLATQAQLKLAKKLILEIPRLMEKGGHL